MKHSVRLSSLDAPIVADHLATILASSEPPPKSVLLIAEESRPVVRRLQRRLPGVKWEVTEAGDRLLFEDRSFDAVIALDVIASMPRASRSGLVREILRTARDQAIVAAPLGTELQKLIEESLASLHRHLLGFDQPWLAAHKAHGLPTPEESFSWVRHGEEADIFYAGDVSAYQHAAEFLIRSAASGRFTRFLAQLTKHLMIETRRTEFELETVPMRRHRRFYLHLRRA